MASPDEPDSVPQCLVEIAIEPKSKVDQAKLGVALAKLAAEDPSFRVSTDQESGQTILMGTGELHLDTKVEILRRTWKLEAHIGAPQGAFRERVTSKAEVDYTHRKQSGGAGQFARVTLVVEPTSPARDSGAHRANPLARNDEVGSPGATKQPVGQITSAYPKSCQAVRAKIFRLTRRANHL
jgi:translation elongation factor EF-G